MKRYISNVFIAACAFLLIFFSDRASDAAYNAMNVCAFTVIPSLFPYMVLSSLLVTSGTAEAAAKIIGKPIAKLLCIPANSVSAIIMGALCGFPLGAKTSLDLYSAGLLTDKETEHLIAISNNTGPAFIIEVAGRKYFGSPYVGIMFYVVQLASAFIVALIYGRIDRKNMVDKGRYAEIKAESSKKTLSASFAAAVSDAARSSVVVSGFIVFFSVISGYIAMLGEAVGMSDIIITVINSLLEFSGATRDAANYPGIAGMCIAAFAVNFGGFSVLAQSAALVDGEKISLKDCLICKGAQGAVAVIITFLVCKSGLFDYTNTAEGTVMAVRTETFTFSLLLLLMLCTLFNAVKHKNDVFRK